MAKQNNFDWFRGEDVLITFTEGPTDTTNTDITGWTISCAVKAALTDPAPMLTIAGTLLVPASGTYSVAFSAAVNTTTLSAGRYHYAVERTDTASVAVLSIGTIQVKPSAKLA